MNSKVHKLINQLNLKPHPEGGYFRETYRSSGIYLMDEKTRSYSTSIYFLLTSESFSSFHRIKQDEIWHFYLGSPIELHTISQQGFHQKYSIGSNIYANENLQLVVPANHWFAAKVMEKDSYSLVGCTVSPGFDFEDLEIANRESLISEFPNHESLIRQFTH